MKIPGNFVKFLEKFCGNFGEILTYFLKIIVGNDFLKIS